MSSFLFGKGIHVNVCCYNYRKDRPFIIQFAISYWFVFQCLLLAYIYTKSDTSKIKYMYISFLRKTNEFFVW